MPGAGRPGGGGGGQSHVPAGATSPARSAGRAARSPSSSRPGAHPHAAGARTPGGHSLGAEDPGHRARKLQTLCGSCPLRKPLRPRPQSPRCSEPGSGRLRWRRGRGLRPAEPGAARSSVYRGPALPPSPARALRAPDIIHSRTLACPLRLPAVTHPGPEAPADSRGRVSSRRPAELEKPVRLLRKAVTADPPLCGPRRCSEGGAWQAARGGSQPQVERRARQTSLNAGGDQSGKVLWVPLPVTFRGGAREGISHLRTSSGFGNCFPIATCAGRGHPR